MVQWYSNKNFHSFKTRIRWARIKAIKSPADAPKRTRTRRSDGIEENKKEKHWSRPTNWKFDSEWWSDRMDPLRRMPNLTQPSGRRSLGPLPDGHFGSIPTTTSRLCGTNATSRRLKGHPQSICFQLLFCCPLPVAYLHVHLIPAICKSVPNQPLAFKRAKIDRSRNLNILRPLESRATFHSFLLPSGSFQIPFHPAAAPAQPPQIFFLPIY